ncbi:MAG: hypothetical protein P1U56_13325 [Saprospiraceae bacterium]|nr:hypothetical protein [Saprospiraceae bacterium]
MNYKIVDMRLLILMVVVFLASCKPDAPVTTQSEDNTPSQTVPAKNSRNEGGEQSGNSGSMTKADGKKPSSGITNYNKEGIPDACDLLSTKTIARYVNQPAEEIFLADGSSPQNPLARACFFKWDGSAIANAGVMVQLQRNPVQVDVPEYFTYLISSKKTDGEKNPASPEVFKYKDWPGFGDDGAYSTEAGKYVWRISNDWAFMVAFNTVLEPKAQKIAAEAFAQEVMSNMEF